jgi:hypothetical protein
VIKFEIYFQKRNFKIKTNEKAFRVPCRVHSCLATKTHHEFILQTLLATVRKRDKDRMQENGDNKFELHLRANNEHLHALKFVIFCHTSVVEKGKV